MDYRLAMVLGAALLASAGCQNTRASLTALENENRRLEDRVYQLEDALNQHCDVVDSLDRENYQLRAQTVMVGSSNNGTSGNGSGGNGGNGNGRNGSGEPRNLTPPDVEIGEPATPNGGANGKNGDPQEDPGPAPPFDGPKPEFPRLLPNHGTPATPASFDARSVEKLKAASANCMRITLDRLKGAQLAHSGQPGIVFIVEPRDAGGKLIPSVGEVSLVVIDTKRQGDAARLARWDFAADQAVQCLRNTALGPRMFFHLDWPEAPKDNQNLRLYARLKTADGRALQADAPLELGPERSIIREWNKDEEPQPAEADAAAKPDESESQETELPRLEVQDAFDGTAGEDDADTTEEAEDSEENQAEEDRRAERSPRARRRSARAAARQRPVWAPFR